MGILQGSVKTNAKHNATAAMKKVILLETVLKETGRKLCSAIIAMKLGISLVIAKVTLELLSMIFINLLSRIYVSTS